MMKKNVLALVFMAGMGAAFAVGATAIDDDPITTTDCPLLGEQVTLNMSNNVSGAYSCDETNSVIMVAACHKAGSRKPTDVPCAIVTPAAGETPAVYNDSSCTGAEGQTFEITDYRGYVASSQGGSVAAQDLGGNCTATTADALVD